MDAETKFIVSDKSRVFEDVSFRYLVAIVFHGIVMVYWTFFSFFEKKLTFGFRENYPLLLFRICLAVTIFTIFVEYAFFQYTANHTADNIQSVNTNVFSTIMLNTVFIFTFTFYAILYLGHDIFVHPVQTAISCAFFKPKRNGDDGGGGNSAETQETETDIFVLARPHAFSSENENENENENEEDTDMDNDTDNDKDKDEGILARFKADWFLSSLQKNKRCTPGKLSATQFAAQLPFVLFAALVAIKTNTRATMVS